MCLLVKFTPMPTIFSLPLFLFLSTLVIVSNPAPAPAANVSPINGGWQLLQASIGISAMHMQLLRNNKVVMFDRTDFGSSNLSLPWSRCRYDPADSVLQTDCSAHSVLYDIPSNTFRPLMVQTDTWCSSGSVLPDGTLVQTGGYNDGDHVVRVLAPCNAGACSEDWVEFPGYLAERRWYSTDQVLPDGRIIIMGGRRQYNFEFYPRNPAGAPTLIWLDFLQETRDGDSENNLYPFLHLLPNGNLFLFANIRSIEFDYKNNRVVREFPPIPGGDPRNYPSSGSSVLLPLDENQQPTIRAQVMLCGGAPRGAFVPMSFARALSTCGRIVVSDQNATWVMETMPMPRVMGDMILLPDENIIIINGAGLGTAGWENARYPITRPLIYEPDKARFSVMQPASRPRLYHSTAVLIPDGRVLVGGSNPHVFYNFTNVEYPTELSLEAFSPPYLASVYDPIRPDIIHVDGEVLRYKQAFGVTFKVGKLLKWAKLSVRIVSPSFTTHSFGMNQRMVVLKNVEVSYVGVLNAFRVSVIGPSTAEIAPPGYYLLFVVHAGIPSSGMWVRIQG